MYKCTLCKLFINCYVSTFLIFRILPWIWCLPWKRLQSK